MKKYIKIAYTGDNLVSLGEALNADNIQYACEFDYTWFTIDVTDDTDGQTEEVLKNIAKDNGSVAVHFMRDREIPEHYFCNPTPWIN